MAQLRLLQEECPWSEGECAAMKSRENTDAEGASEVVAPDAGTGEKRRAHPASL